MNILLVISTTLILLRLISISDNFPYLMSVAEFPAALLPVRNFLSLAAQYQPFQVVFSYYCLILLPSHFNSFVLFSLPVRRYVVDYIVENKLVAQPEVKAFVPSLLDLTEPVCLLNPYHQCK